MYNEIIVNTVNKLKLPDAAAVVDSILCETLYAL
jgi:hypothetical protein